MKEVVDACMGAEGLTYSIDDSEIGMETGTLAFVHIWASRAANMDDPEKSDYVGGIGFAGSPAPDPDSGILGGSAWIDAYSIAKRSGVDHDLAFRAIMETFDFEGQVGGSAHGAVVRTSVAEAGHGGPQSWGDGCFARSRRRRPLSKPGRSLGGRRPQQLAAAGWLRRSDAGRSAG